MEIGTLTNPAFQVKTGNAGAITALTLLNNGNLGIGLTDPSTSLHVIKTTEQFRIGYNSTQYFSATVSSAGNITLNANGGTIFTPNAFECTVATAGLILKSPDGTRYRLTVNNGGTLSVSDA